jgi:hypothetical protein
MIDEMQWVEELPVPANGRRVAPNGTKHFIERLKERPGVWAVYREFPFVTKKTRCGSYRKHYPGTQWAQRSSDGVTRVYVRWIGEENV